MALFQRNNTTTETTTEDPQQLDNYVENLISNSDIDVEIESHFNNPKSNYRIEDAVELMRRLPQDNSNMIISVVTETLKSANIDVTQIINDAETKSTETELKIHALSMEINSLEKQVSEKKIGIENAQKNLKETQQVKVLLEQSQKTVASHKTTNLKHNPEPKNHPQDDNSIEPPSELSASSY